MTPTLTIDASGFAAMCRDLGSMSGQTFRHVVRDQAAKVLETAIRYTPIAKASEIQKHAGDRVERRFNTYSGGETGRTAASTFPHISISPKRRKKWWVTRNKSGARTFYDMNGKRKWSDERWAQYLREEADREADLKVAIAQAVKRAKAARGLARQVWLQAAQDLDLQIRYSPRSIANAVPSDGRRYDNADGQEFSPGSSFFIEIINRYPVIAADRASQILQQAVNTRLKAFAIETSKGVFDDIEARAKRYPGVFVI